MAARGSHESVHPRWSVSSQGSRASLVDPVAEYYGQGRRGSLSAPPQGMMPAQLGYPAPHSAFPSSHVPHLAQPGQQQARQPVQPHQYFAVDPTVTGRPPTVAPFPNEHLSFQRHREARQRDLALRPGHGGAARPSSHVKPAGIDGRAPGGMGAGVAFPLPPRAEEMVKTRGLEGRKRGTEQVQGPVGTGAPLGPPSMFPAQYSMAGSAGWQADGLAALGRPNEPLPATRNGGWPPSSRGAVQQAGQGDGQYSPRGTCYELPPLIHTDHVHGAPATGPGWDFALPASKRRRIIDAGGGVNDLQLPTSAVIEPEQDWTLDTDIPVHSPNKLAPPGGLATISSLSNATRAHTPGHPTATPSPLASASFFDNSEPAGAASAPKPADASPPSSTLPPNYPLHNLALALRSPPAADFAAPSSSAPAASPHPHPGSLPREQPRRWAEDGYTPLWVRKDGKLKEGWCALCPGAGKWLCLKNSEYWYHRQFHHGISSVSGRPFLPPYEVREVGKEAAGGAGASASTSGGGGGGGTGGGKMEGLCHSCGDVSLVRPHTSPILCDRADCNKPLHSQWQPYSNPKAGAGELRGAPNVWFRHAHSCHVLIKPKREKAQVSRSLSSAHSSAPVAAADVRVGTVTGSEAARGRSRLSQEARERSEGAAAAPPGRVDSEPTRLKSGRGTYRYLITS